MFHHDVESMYFHAGGHDDERHLRTCLHFLVGVSSVCGEPVARLQNRMPRNVESDWLEQGKHLAEQAKEFYDVESQKSFKKEIRLAS